MSNGTSFTIVHNIPDEHGAVNSLDAALDNWLARIKKEEDATQKSLIDYINSKGVHRAMTREQFDELNKSNNL